MLSQAVKQTYFSLARPLMRANATFYRTFRRPKTKIVKVHLGPGQVHYFPSWVNVDANIITAKCDIWADLRHKLPFPDSSVDVIYSHHVIEHLPNLQFHFNEIYRCLKPNGMFRVGGPNGDAAMRKYVAGDSTWFSNFPINRKSIGGRLENFIFCAGEHLTILTLSYIEEIAQKAGFGKVAMCCPVTETNFPTMIDQTVLSSEYEDTPTCPHTLIVEGCKGPW